MVAVQNFLPGVIFLQLDAKNAQITLIMGILVLHKKHKIKFVCVSVCVKFGI